MEHSPIMRSADERKQAQQMLKPIATESSTQGIPSPLRPSRFHEGEGGGGENPILGLGLCSGPFRDYWEPLQPTQYDAKVTLPRWRRLQKFDCLFDTLDDDKGVSGRVTLPHEKGAMTDDAIANFAEPGKIDEQPLLE